MYATDEDVIRLLEDRRVLLNLLLDRAIELVEENQALLNSLEALQEENAELRNELRARRHQADVWRKKAQRNGGS